MHLEDLIASVSEVHHAHATGRNPDLASIELDSRQVTPGTLFVALSGAAVDGHDFLRAAVERGAVAVLVDEGRADEAADLGVDVLTAADTRRSLGPVATRFFGDPAREMAVVGVTGTNGKTTVTFLLERAFEAAGIKAGIIGTVNYRWPGTSIAAPNTTPESLVVQRLLRSMRDDGVEAVAMEVSSHGLATHRVRGALFDVAVFTNFTQDHLDFHESMDAYRDAKRRLFDTFLPLSREGGKPAVAVLNLDDAEGRALVGVCLAAGNSVVTYGFADDADVRVVSCDATIAGTNLELLVGGRAVAVPTRLLGRFNASNAAAVLAVFHGLGWSVESAADGLRDAAGVPGRLQHLGGGQAPDVFVDYAHTPDALERALEALRPLVDGQLHVVFGCGGDRDKAKRPIMGRIAATHADVVVLTSDNPRHEDPDTIIAEIARGVGAVPHAGAPTVLSDRRAAIQHALRAASPGDVVVIAGKGHETYQEIRGERFPFDDVQVVLEVLG